MGQTTIRPAVAADLPALVDLDRRCFPQVADFALANLSQASNDTHDFAAALLGELALLLIR